MRLRLEFVRQHDGDFDVQIGLKKLLSNWTPKSTANHYPLHLSGIWSKVLLSVCFWLKFDVSNVGCLGTRFEMSSCVGMSWLFLCLSAALGNAEPSVTLEIKYANMPYRHGLSWN